MSMKIVTWNMQGLRSRLDQQNRWKLRRDLEEFFLGSVADIIMLQEHHLDSTQSKEVRDLLPISWRTIWDPTIGEDGNHSGICTLIRENLAQGLIHEESLIPGRAHFCTLAIQGQRWNFMNVYAPNSRTKRATFWERTLLQVAGTEEWCIGGDFNMIESIHNSSNNNPIVLQGRERKQWEKLCVHLNLRDIWHSDNFQRKRDSLLFSRSDGRNSGPTLSRIDRIYVGEALEAKGGWCRITPGTTFSDHYPLVGHFQLHRKWGLFQPRIPSTIYTVIEVKEQLSNQWSLLVEDSSTSDKLLAKLTRASALLHEIVKTRSKDAQEKLQRTKHGLISLQ